MANSKFDGLMGSEILKIKAAILEVMEGVGFNSQEEVGLKESSADDTWSMVFPKKSIELKELKDVNNKLGRNFTIKLEAHSKEVFDIILEAPKDEFKKLLGEKKHNTSPEPAPIFPAESSGGGLQ